MSQNQRIAQEQKSRTPSIEPGRKSPHRSFEVPSVHSRSKSAEEMDPDNVVLTNLPTPPMRIKKAHTVPVIRGGYNNTLFDKRQAKKIMVANQSPKRGRPIPRSKSEPARKKRGVNIQ